MLDFPAMHELGLVTEVYKICRASLETHGEGRIRSVRLAVGELSAVEPELLRFAWEAVTAEGADEGADLVVEWHVARQRCPACGEEKPRASGDWLRVCPDCGGPLLVEGGNELEILDIEVEVKD